MKANVLAKLTELHPEMIEIRRDLHMHPELSFQEKRTAAVIAEYQRQLGLEVQTGVGGNGVVAKLTGGKPGKTVAIRADFDALPIEEANDVPYKSKNSGVMHACGHDAHTAIALGLSKAFVEYKDELKGNIVFIHQHAEESKPGGARDMIADGCLEGVDVIFATHMENYTSVGNMLYSKSHILAASDEFEIKIKGLGGHAAFPQDTKDALVIGTQLANNLQSIISRRVDPLKSAVVTIGAFRAGETHNVIPETATMKGTVRSFDEDVRDSISKSIEKITQHTCQMYDAEYEMTYDRGFPATKNDESMTELLVDSAANILGDENLEEIPPNMGGEDFSYFLQQVPGSYFFTGSANADKGIVHPYHHPKFDIDEDALLNGSKVLAAVTLDYLQKYNG
ncbi:MAG TPA: M20 family metallopeptidase [Bacillales bacterium]